MAAHQLHKSIETDRGRRMVFRWMHKTQDLILFIVIIVAAVLDNDHSIVASSKAPKVVLQAHVLLRA